MAQGLIVLALLAGLVAFLTARLQRRMGIAVSARTWIVVMTGFVLLVLALWAGSHG
jgi:hypothetical protein